MFETPHSEPPDEDDDPHSGDIATGGGDFITRHLLEIAIGIMMGTVVLLYIFFPESVR